VLLAGSGARSYRGYAFDALTSRYRVALIDYAEPTWQADRIADHAVADLRDPDMVRRAVRTMSRRHHLVGVLTWDEFTTVSAATAAQDLGLPASNPAAVAACRNKARTRAVLDAHHVPSAQWQHVSDLAGAREAASRIGYPVVLKPAAAGGSAGVVRVDDGEQLTDAFAFAAEAAAGQGREGTGMLVESYLEGPEVSVEIASHTGRHHVVAVTRKMLGPEPYFEETGHVVAGLPDAGDPAAQVAVDALNALGIGHGISHVEVRLTPTGPRIIEINPRLGGDLIPHLVHLATGIDVVAAAADLATGRTPDLTPGRNRAAGVRFLYPEIAGRVNSVSIDAEIQAAPWCERSIVEKTPGTRVSPGDGLYSRLAHLVVTAPTATTCRARLDEAAAGVHSDITALPDSR
jgi:biotin carboxylase